MKAVIPAAGKGTRFAPWTYRIPKELLPVIDPHTKKMTAVLELVAREAYDAGCSDIIIITASGKTSISEYFIAQEKFGNLPKGIRIHYTNQNEQRGLGDAVGCAKTHVGTEDFAVLLGDDFYENNPTKELLDAYEAKRFDGKFGAVLTVQKVPDELLGRYGVVKVSASEKIMVVHDIVEKPQSNAPSNYAVTGRYILSNKVFPYIEKIALGTNGEIQLTDAIRAMICDGYKIYCIEISGKRYDAGDPDSWSQTIADLKNRKIFS